MKNQNKLNSEKQEMIQRWHRLESEQGITQREFCKQEKISFHTFYYWKRKLTASSNRKSKKFIRLITPRMPLSLHQGLNINAQPFAEILFENGRRLTLHRKISCGELKRLLK